MALAPGETNESFIREVDENLRRSQAESFFRRYGLWLIGGALLILLAAGGLLYWRHQQAELARQHSETMTQVMIDIGAGRTGTVAARLDEIAESGNDSYRATALLTQAAVALQTGDRTKAAQAYRTVREDEDLPQEFRNTALVRGTAVEFDSLQPEEVVNRLQELAKPGSAWFGTAGELTAMAMMKQNRNAEAGRLFAAIANDQTVPGSIRGRAQQIAGTLGADASAAPGQRT